MVKVEQLKNPASIVGALLLIFLGGYIAGSSQMSIGSKDPSKPSKELSKTVRISIGVAILLVGAIILFTHTKKSQ